MRPRLPALLVLLVVALAGLALVLVLRGGDAAREELAATRAVARGPAEGAPVPDELAPAAVVASGPDARTAVAAPRAEPAPASQRAAPEPKPEGPFLHGRVVDSHGYSIAAAEVRLGGNAAGGFVFGGGPRRARVVTGPDGTFRVPRADLPEGLLQVQVLARGFLALSTDRTPSRPAGDADLGVLTLETGVVLGGLVVDAAGRPVEGAEVVRTTDEQEAELGAMLAMASGMGGSGSRAATTDAAGRFELPHEEEGEYLLVVRHEEHPRGRFEGRTPPLGGERLDLVLRLPPAAAIVGRIEGYPQGKEFVLVRVTPQQRHDESEPDGMAALFQAVGFGGEDATPVEPDGTFRIPGLHADADYEVQAFQKDGLIGQTPCTESRTVRSGTADLTLHWRAGATIAFRVLDAATSAEVGDVDVRFRWTQGSSLGVPNLPKKRSFEGHEVRIDELRPVPPPGTLELLVSAPGYLEHREVGLTVQGDEEIDLGVVRLVRAPVLRVRVVDARSGEPIRRARVVLRATESIADALAGLGYVGDDEDDSDPDPFYFGTDPSGGQTDADGWCELPVPAGGTGTLSARKSGYAAWTEELGLPSQGTREKVLRLQAGGVAEVLVVDTAGAPVEGADVLHRAPDGDEDSRRTRGDGIARFKDLGPGVHGFRAERSASPVGNLRVSFEVDTGDGEGEDGAEPDWRELGVGSGETSELTLVLPSVARLTGRVLARGVPVAHAQVMLLEGAESSAEDEALALFSESMSSFLPGAPRRTRTDELGEFRLTELAPGTHRVRVQRDDGSPSHEVRVELREGDNHVDVELPGNAIEGRVVDAGGQPVGGATVRVVRADADAEWLRQMEEAAAAAALFGGGGPSGVRTAEDGRFVVEGVPVGVPVRVVARAAGFVRGRSSEVTVAADGVERDVQVELERAGSILVRVLGETGPFLVATAEYEGDADPPPAGGMAMVRGGQARLDDLAPGPWRIELSGPGHEDSEGQLVEVRAGEEIQVALSP